MKTILNIIDAPEGDITGQLASATAALTGKSVADLAAQTYPRLAEVVPMLGSAYLAGPPAMALLEDALEAVEDAGLHITERQMAIYGKHMLAVAHSEIAPAGRLDRRLGCHEGQSHRRVRQGCDARHRRYGSLPGTLPTLLAVANPELRRALEAGR